MNYDKYGNAHFRSYVYTAFKLGKSAIQLTEDLQKVFGVDDASCLRTIYYVLTAMDGGCYKDGSFNIRKNVSSMRPRFE